MSPAERKAKELGVDIARVEGTGARGNVLVADVIAYAAKQKGKAKGRKKERAGRPFRLGIVTKFWGRPSVSAFMQAMCLKLPELVEGIEVVCVGARSPGDPQPAKSVEGWEYVEAPNAPLSDKGNAASRELKGKVDAVLNLGSDDIVSPAYLRAAMDALAEYDYVEPDSLVYHDLETDKSVAVDANRVGAGRLFSRDLMERMDWEPWASGPLPDVDSDRKLSGMKVKRKRLSGRDIEGGLVVLDLKDGHSIGSFQGVTSSRLKSGKAAYVETDAVLAACQIPSDLWQSLLDGYASEQVPVRMKALVNVPGGMAGMDRATRIERGDEFVAPPRAVRGLIRYRYARPL